jgi:Tfp pilus assembly protein PilX
MAPAGQRGFMLIVAVFLIVVAAVLASVITFRVVGGNQSSGDTLTHAQALYLAHTGIERWIRQRALNNAFTGETATAFGNGTFTTTTDTTNDCNGNALAANRVSVTSVGNVTATSAAATVCAVIDLLRLGGAMMVYAREDSLGIPFYRRWNHSTNSWGAEQAANDVGPQIFFMVLKFARTRNEAMLVVQDTNGDISVQTWNGTTWSAPIAVCDAGGASDDFRGFDIEYETQNDRAVLVCNNNVANQATWRLWNGTAWTAPATVALGSIGDPLWIEMASNPLGNSNEIALIALGSNSDVCGTRWNGTAWVAMGCDWDDSAATSTTKAIDVAYEQLSGRAMFIWGDNNNDDQRWRTWDGTTLSGINMLTIGDMGGVAEWMRLVPRPGSNQMMYVVQDDSGTPDLNSAFWNGAAFAVNTPDHDAGTESGQSMNFDFVFETHPARAGRGWLVWGDDSTISRREWTGAVWNAAAAVAGSDDTSFVRLAAQPSSGAVFAGAYENSSSGGGAQDDIYEMHQTGGGGVWSALALVWDGGTIADPVHFRVDIAPERHTPVVTWQEVFP